MDNKNANSSIKFDAVIYSQNDSIDMKSGLDTLQGISDATRKIGEVLLTKKVAQRLHHGSSIRTQLKQSFKGSYGQIFSLEIYDPSLRKELAKIGKPQFVELMGYFIKESLYEVDRDLSEKAQAHLEKIGDAAEELIKNLRTSCMENIHEVPSKFGYDVSLNYRKNSNDRVIIGNFTKRSALTLQAEPSKDEFDIIASITRLNINTGNGRLKQEGIGETFAFGFSSAYSEIKVEAKKVFSANLDFNNGVSEEKWKTLRLKVSPIKLRDGRVVKYIITGYYND
ncbi:hypothetical protein [uncultured Xanthomonas sp.]|uniref:hypothetical protein n=1 Tax=Xanthomonas sontii TaxID=2650745 RepID=UPI0025F49465|nr:hypothetical protein [uncultured Xanthomonas sp.]